MYASLSLQGTMTLLKKGGTLYKYKGEVVVLIEKLKAIKIVRGSSVIWLKKLALNYFMGWW